MLSGNYQYQSLENFKYETSLINFNELFTRYGKLILNDYLINMQKKYILLISPLLFLSSKISALPACDGNFVRHCYGTIFHQNGENMFERSRITSIMVKDHTYLLTEMFILVSLKMDYKTVKEPSHLQMAINTKEDLKMVITMEKVLQLQTERIIQEIS